MLEAPVMSYERVHLTGYQDKLETDTSFFISPETSVQFFSGIKRVITVRRSLFVYAVMKF